MFETCAPSTVDDNAARWVAGIIVALGLLSLWPPAHWLSAVAAADFSIRAWGNRRYSPMRWVAKQITAGLRTPPRFVYAPPKQFAARIGSVMTLGATALYLAGLDGGAILLTVALLSAASLEAFAGFCIACWLYPLVFSPRRI